MKRKIVAVLAAVVLSLAIPAAVMAQTTAIQARDTALELTNGGTLMGLSQVTEAGQTLHHVIIDNNVRFNVFVSVSTGDVVRVTTGQIPGVAQQPAPAAPAQQAAPGGGNIAIPANVVPRPPARPGGPANPPISAQRAVELARNHLVSIGVTQARFDYVYMDIERGRWVWSVEFDGPGRDFEFYVDVQTGAFLNAPR
ncbi:MAG: PepSY domain-containing protein [Spirochaetes bacterium]|nr:PepSY domain-containing protein [Spirochaetota bacterium]